MPIKPLAFLAFLALSLAFAAPIYAQQIIPAPPGWTQQDRGKGARTYTPNDLKTGEKFSITTYDSAPVNGQTLEEYLRGFAGKVGKGVGELAAPLSLKASDGRIVTATGIYNGPGGAQLVAVFVGVSLDGGANVHVMRTLLSGPEGIVKRYQSQSEQVMTALFARAKAEAGDSIQRTPAIVKQKLARVGGELKPGVYAGNLYRGDELSLRYHVYIFANGEYLLCDQNDRNITKRFFDELSGEVKYNRNSGQLDLDWTMGLGTYGGDGWCYYGQDANGKPAIYAEQSIGDEHALLTWIGPPTKRLSKSDAEAAAAAAEAEKNRYKYVVAPGKGVQSAQIAAVLLDSKFNGGSADETVYLLLKDGSVYADLPVPPDELDVLKSKQREPDKWGKWRLVGKTYKVSWAGAPYQNLPGSKVSPAPAQTKLAGRWGTGRFSGTIGMMASSSQWGVTFGKNGRFRKDSRSLTTSSMGFGDNQTNIASGSNDGESFAGGSGPGFAFSSSQKKNNPNGAREGDYSLSGYVLTLRYDNGDVTRLPFFFADSARKIIWFEGNRMDLDEKK